MYLTMVFELYVFCKITCIYMKSIYVYMLMQRGTVLYKLLIKYLFCSVLFCIIRVKSVKISENQTTSKWLLRKHRMPKLRCFQILPTCMHREIYGIQLSLSPSSTTIVPLQTTWIRMRRRVTRRLIQNQAVWHTYNILTNFEQDWRTLKTDEDEQFSKRRFIWRAKG